jgi:hypothetical protein
VGDGAGVSWRIGVAACGGASAAIHRHHRISDGGWLHRFHSGGGSRPSGSGRSSHSAAESCHTGGVDRTFDIALALLGTRSCTGAAGYPPGAQIARSSASAMVVG